MGAFKLTKQPARAIEYDWFLLIDPIKSLGVGCFVQLEHG